MNPEPLPPGLRELEAHLARRPCPGPASDFRARLLTAAACVSPPAMRRWDLVWISAAAVVLALNLGMSAANGVRFQRLSATAESAPREWARVPDDLDGTDSFQQSAKSALANVTPA